MLLELVRHPGPQAYLCTMPGGYERVAEILQCKYHERRKEDSPWGHYPDITRRNCVVALIKAKAYNLADDICSKYLKKARENHAGHSPTFWAFWCIQAACIILSQKDHRQREADVMYAVICSRKAHRSYPPVQYEFEALQWVYHRRQDHLVLRYDYDGLPDLEEVTDYTLVPLSAMPEHHRRGSDQSPSTTTSPAWQRCRALIKLNRKNRPTDVHPYLQRTRRRRDEDSTIEALQQATLRSSKSKVSLKDGWTISPTESSTTTRVSSLGAQIDVESLQDVAITGRTLTSKMLGQSEPECSEVGYNGSDIPILFSPSNETTGHGKEVKLIEEGDEISVGWQAYPDPDADYFLHAR